MSGSVDAGVTAGFTRSSSQASLSQASLSPNPHALPTPSITAPSTAPSNGALLASHTSDGASDMTRRRSSTQSAQRTINLVFDNISKLNAPVPVSWHDDRRPSHSSASTYSTNGPATPNDLESIARSSSSLYKFSAPKYDDGSPIAVGWEWVVRLSREQSVNPFASIEELSSVATHGTEETSTGASKNVPPQVEFAIRRHPVNRNYDLLTLSPIGQVICCRPVQQKTSVLSLKAPHRFTFDAPVRVGSKGKTSAPRLQADSPASSDNPNALVAIDTEWVWKGSYNNSMNLVQYSSTEAKAAKKKGLNIFGKGGEGEDEHKIVLAEYVRYSSRPALHISAALPEEFIPLVLASLYPIIDSHRHDFASRFNMPADDDPVDPPAKWDTRILLMGQQNVGAKQVGAHQGRSADLAPEQEDAQSVAPPYEEENLAPEGQQRSDPPAIVGAA